VNEEKKIKQLEFTDHILQIKNLQKANLLLKE